MATAEVNALFQQIGGKQIAKKRRASDPFSFLQRAIKLAVGTSDATLAHLLAHNGTWQFWTSDDVVAIAATLDGTTIDLGDKPMSMPLKDWQSVVTVALAFKGVPLEVTRSTGHLTLAVQSSTIADLGRYLEGKKKALSYGAITDKVINFPVQTISPPPIFPESPKGAVDVTAGAIIEALKAAKPLGSKTLVELSNGRVSFGKSKTTIGLSKFTMQALVKAITKLAALKGTLALLNESSALELISKSDSGWCCVISFRKQ